MGTGLAPPTGVRSASDGYRPRQPDRDALRQVVCEHFETFRDRIGGRRDGQGLPRFVFREVMLQMYQDQVAGPAPRFPPQMEQRITEYLQRATQAPVLGENRVPIVR